MLARVVWWRERAAGERGQVAVLLVGGLVAVLVGALVLGAVARGLGTRDAAQRAADLAALGGARAMQAAYPRLFEPAVIDERPNPRHLDEGGVSGARAGGGRARGARERRAAGAGLVSRTADTFAPVRVRVAVERRLEIAGRVLRMPADAEAELSPGRAPVRRRSRPAAATTGRWPTGRASRCARTSRWRSTAWRRPRATTACSWSSPAAFAPTPSRRSCSRAARTRGGSRGRARRCIATATELDLGPPSAYGWLAANAGRFHFIQRYSWEPWHYGFVLNPRSSPQTARAIGRAAGGEPAGLRARAVRAGDQPRRAALERLGHAAGRPALRRERVQPVRREPRRRAGHRAVHARHGARHGARGPVRRRTRRSTPRRI